MKKIILPMAMLFAFSCTQDGFHEKLETFDIKLTIDSFISVYEEAARIKADTIPVNITLLGNGNPYDNQYVINSDSELILKGLLDREYILYANAFLDGTLYYCEVRFNPAVSASLEIVLEAVVTKFKVTPVNWPATCERIEVALNYDWVTMIDETAYYLNKLFAGGGQHLYKIESRDIEPEYYYATPFETWSIEIYLYSDSSTVLAHEVVDFKKTFERLKAYNIKLDLEEMMGNTTKLSFAFEDLVFEEIDLDL